MPGEVQRHISAVRSVSCAFLSAVWWRRKHSTGRCWAWWLSTRCAWPSFITTSPGGCPVSSVSRVANTSDICPCVERLDPFLSFQTMQSSCFSVCSWLRCFWRCTAWDRASTSILPSTALIAVSVLRILRCRFVPVCGFVLRRPSLNSPSLSQGHRWQHLRSAVGFLQAWNFVWHQCPASSPSAEDLQNYQVSASVFLFLSFFLEIIYYMLFKVMSCLLSSDETHNHISLELGWWIFFIICKCIKKGVFLHTYCVCEHNKKSPRDCPTATLKGHSHAGSRTRALGESQEWPPDHMGIHFCSALFNTFCALICRFTVKVLGISKKPGCLPDELHEVHHLPHLPPLPLHRRFCSPWHAALWWQVTHTHSVIQYLAVHESDYLISHNHRRAKLIVLVKHPVISVKTHPHKQVDTFLVYKNIVWDCVTLEMCTVKLHAQKLAFRETELQGARPTASPERGRIDFWESKIK